VAFLEKTGDTRSLEDRNERDLSDQQRCRALVERWLKDDQNAAKGAMGIDG